MYLIKHLFNLFLAYLFDPGIVTTADEDKRILEILTNLNTLLTGYEKQFEAVTDQPSLGALDQKRWIEVKDVVYQLGKIFEPSATWHQNQYQDKDFFDSGGHLNDKGRAIADKYSALLKRSTNWGVQQLYRNGWMKGTPAYQIFIDLKSTQNRLLSKFDEKMKAFDSQSVKLKQVLANYQEFLDKIQSDLTSTLDPKSLDDLVNISKNLKENTFPTKLTEAGLKDSFAKHHHADQVNKLIKLHNNLLKDVEKRIRRKTSKLPGNNLSLQTQLTDKKSALSEKEKELFKKQLNYGLSKCDSKLESMTSNLKDSPDLLKDLNAAREQLKIQPVKRWLLEMNLDYEMARSLAPNELAAFEERCDSTLQDLSDRINAEQQNKSKVQIESIIETFEKLLEESENAVAHGSLSAKQKGKHFKTFPVNVLQKKIEGGCCVSYADVKEDPSFKSRLTDLESRVRILRENLSLAQTALYAGKSSNQPKTGRHAGATRSP
jgi:hypothetical protein